ncbi:MAG: hypothetical protein ACI89E_002298 [Planctomycetota bacterium]|jgi:hypothetical protein
MRFVHPSHGAASVRLAYCTNLHAGESLPEIRQGLEDFAVAVKRALGVQGTFGVGLYLPAKVALHLASEHGRHDLDGFASWLEQQGLEAFTFNAFPYGDFQRDGLKAAVYRPTWETPERAAYTAAVAKVAPLLMRRRSDSAGNIAGNPSGHISISTHPGAHVSQVDDGEGHEKYLLGLAGAVVDLVRSQSVNAPNIVLSLEAEPWAIAGNSIALAGHLQQVSSLAQNILCEEHACDPESARRSVAQHLGTCLDACHSAVEFETASDAVDLARKVGCMGKLQYSNALSLSRPSESPAAVAALLALDEPRFLHQVNGDALAGPQNAADLIDLQQALADQSSRDDWLACEEWRCHFHVPVNLPEFEGLGTTQDHADAILLELLADPVAWKTPELHVEIETYTWNILPGSRPAGIVSGLVAEYRHVLDLLAKQGWARCEDE